MREIVHIQAGQCGNQIGAKVSLFIFILLQWNEILGFLKFGRPSFWCPPFSISRRRVFCCCHTWFFFLVLINVNLYIVMSERIYDSKTEPKICKIVSVYRILCMTHSCIPFHLKLFMRVGFIPCLNLNIVFSLLFYVKFKILCSF